MKKFISALLASMLLLPSFVFAADNSTPLKPTIESKAAIVINPETNEVLFEQNADEKLPPASITKVMTLALAADALKKGTIKRTDMVPISEKAWKTGGSRMFLEVGHQVSVDDLLKGIAVDSGNDACVALAEFMSGSIDQFITLMNEKAKELHMKNTIFGSVNGLPNGNTSLDTTSARDIGILASYYIKNFPDLLAYNSLKEFDFDVGRGKHIKQYNHNPLISNNYPGADGLKTGFITNHFNIVGTAKRNGLRIVAVTLKASSEGNRFNDIKSLLDFGFAAYKVVEIGKKGDVIQNIRVYKSTSKHVDVILADNKTITIKVDQESEVTEQVVLPSYISGAKKAGEVIGKKIILVHGKPISEIPLVLKEDLKKAGFFQRFFDSIAIGFNWLLSLF